MFSIKLNRSQRRLATRVGDSARHSPRAKLWTSKLEDRIAPAAFTPGDLVVYRVGDGSAALGSSATAAFLDEYTTGGSLVQSIAIRTTDSGAQQTLTNSGSASNEGALSLSADGRFLLFGGYHAAVGTAGVATSSTGTVLRVYGRAAADGTVDTTTTTTSYSGAGIRGVASTNGTDLWAVGSATGVIYSALGGSGADTVVSSTFTNIRTISVVGGQLYVSAGASALRLGTVGTGTPTTTGQTTTNLPGYPTAAIASNAFFFADLSPSVPGVDTVYVGDDTSTTTGLQKYSLVNGSWVANGNIAITNGNLRGLTGVVNGTSVTLYVTGGTNQLTLNSSSRAA